MDDEIRLSQYIDDVEAMADKIVQIHGHHIEDLVDYLEKEPVSVAVQIRVFELVYGKDGGQDGIMFVVKGYLKNIFSAEFTKYIKLRFSAGVPSIEEAAVYYRELISRLLAA